MRNGHLCRPCRGFLVALGILFCAGVAGAQLRISGQASAAFLASENGPSQYVVDAGRHTFAWRLDLFGDAEISEHLLFMSNFRVMQDQTFEIALLALRATDIASTGINADAGLIEIPFGNLGARRFPWTNPFYSLPLTHEHRTTLTSATYVIMPDEYSLTSGNGFRLIDQDLYDAGIKLSTTIGICDLSVALINGMISSTSTYASGAYGNGMNVTGGFGKVARAAVTPMTGLTIGASYAYGPFLRPVNNGYSTPVDPSAVPQEIVEGDIDFSLGHVALYAEGFWNNWKLRPLYGSDLKAAGFSVEGKFTPFTRFSLAGRVGGVFFNSTSYVLDPSYTTVYTGPWDHDVLRYEAATGYRLDRDVLVKVAYQWNVTRHVDADPNDNLLAIQTVVNF